MYLSETEDTVLTLPCFHKTHLKCIAFREKRVMYPHTDAQCAGPTSPCTDT